MMKMIMMMIMMIVIIIIIIRRRKLVPNDLQKSLGEVKDETTLRQAHVEI